MAEKSKAWHGRMSYDPAVEVAWAGVRALDIAQQFQVLRELATRLYAELHEGERGAAARVRVAVAALHDCFDILGHSPSVKTYRTLRAELPELQLPADSSVRSWLGGSWNDCLRRSLLPVDSDGDFSEKPLGSDYTRDELNALVRACADELGCRPSFTNYCAWARRPDVADRFPRRALSHPTFDRYGGFARLLVDAGVIEEKDGWKTATGRVVPSLGRYTDEELVEALREVSAHLRPTIGARSPRVGEYDRGRLQIQQAAEAAGKPRAIPTPDVISGRFQGWDNALIAAGLTPLGGRHTRSNPKPRRPTYDRQQKQEALREAWVACGPPFTSSAYDAWREGKIALAAAEGIVLDLPSVDVIRIEFKGWRKACIESISGYIPPRRRRRDTPPTPDATNE